MKTKTFAKDVMVFEKFCLFFTKVLAKTFRKKWKKIGQGCFDIDPKLSSKFVKHFFENVNKHKNNDLSF
jgi:hypothetical protein